MKKNLMVATFMTMTGLATVALGQSSTPTASSAPHVAPAEAKSHVGEMATVCGKIVDSKVSKYGIAGHGKPVTLDFDQPEPTPVFYMVAFGSQPSAEGAQEVVTAYQGKSVCVSGKINLQAGTPFIMAADRAQIKTQPEAK